MTVDVQNAVVINRPSDGTTYTWESSSGGTTRMTLRNRGTPAGFSVWFAPLLAFAIGRANRKDLALLKRLEVMDE